MDDGTMIGALRNVVRPPDLDRLMNDAADDIERLRAENGRLRECLRVNLLRHVPGITHADIDAKLAEIEAH